VSERTTWDGLPVADDWPHGATVVVWRRLPDNAIELLLLHRAHHGPDYAGDWAWTPPAGSRFPGEDVDACAARELHEEAGLELPMTRFERAPNWATYVARAPADAVVTLHDREHDKYQWVDVETALAIVKPDMVRETIEHALSLIPEAAS
jgi:8-oxo-dGTP pyrophosphatase MutT (NUDIX family)